VRAAVNRRLAAVRVFTDIMPEPTEEQIRAGVAVVEQVKPDTIVALGGGSVMDAAKAMRLFYESPELSMRELSLPFLDARKRVAHCCAIARLGRAAESGLSVDEVRDSCAMV
jgi:acetaldehyde dehydrogenase/alcohol dehydrogenase